MAFANVVEHAVTMKNRRRSSSRVYTTKGKFRYIGRADTMKWPTPVVIDDVTQTSGSGSSKYYALNGRVASQIATRRHGQWVDILGVWSDRRHDETCTWTRMHYCIFGGRGGESYTHYFTHVREPWNILYWFCGTEKGTY